MSRMEALLDSSSSVSSRRWIGIRSAQTLGVTSVAMTLGVLYQICMHRPVDPQLSFLLSANFAALASLASIAFRTKPAGESPTKAIK
jgi:hypothetical protein